MFSISEIHLSKRRCCAEFPSPLGDYVFNQEYKKADEELRDVSVPSRGLCFQSNPYNSLVVLRCSFRPLSGIMFSIGPSQTYLSKLYTVSVPSRGLCFQSTTEGANHYDKTRIVSVPSRGLCFQSTSINLYRTEWNGFRPLSGIMFSICVCNRRLILIVMFPSPLGDYVFNRRISRQLQPCYVGFRPLSGIMFSIQGIQTMNKKELLRFRPLSGIMFSIEAAGSIVLYTKYVSVPSRGLCFQSLYFL